MIYKDWKERRTYLKKKIEEFRFLDPKQALVYSKKLEKEGREQGDRYSVGYALFYIGDTMLSLDHLQKSREYLCRGIELQEKENYLDLLMLSYNEMGILSEVMGEDSMALEWYLKCLELAEEEKNETLAGMIYNNIALLYMEHGEFQESLVFEKKSADLLKRRKVEENQLKISQSRYHMNVSMLYLNLGDIRQAESHFQMACQNMPKDLSQQYRIGISQLKARIEYENGRMESALEECDALAERFQNEWGKTEFFYSYIDVIKLYFQAGKVEKALDMLDSLLETEYCKVNPYKRLIIYDIYIQIYEKIGDEDSAEKWYQLYYDTQNEKNKYQKRELEIMLNTKCLLEEEYKAYEGIEKKNRELVKLSETDGMTGALNRYGMQEYGQNYFYQAKRESDNFSIAALDIDDFKHYNDEFGHSAGDACLIALASILKEAAAEDMLVIRYGGDEFFLIGMNLSEKKIKNILENILRTVRKIVISEVKEKFCVTIGAVSQIPKDTECFMDYMKWADDALYKAKKAGKNCYYLNGQLYKTKRQT